MSGKNPGEIDNPPDTSHPPARCWPEGQPPVSPMSVWGPASPAGPINRAWYWEPQVNPGYTPILRRFSARAQNATTLLYSAAIAPEWLLAFLDPNDDDTPTRNLEFDPVIALRNPLSAEVLFFAAGGTFAILEITNDGKGYEFPQRTPERYMGIYASARRIGTNALVQVTPVIEYRRRE